LCFVGPPGVGKTSLGKSIAEAMGRNFIRVALGGVRDEADIRGHRRTYIGSMPGRIIAELRKAGTRNPVMMLDEIDKMAPTSGAILLPRCSKSSTPRRTTRLPTTISMSRSISRKCSSSRPPIRWTPFPARSATAWEVIEIPVTPRGDKLSIAKQYLAPRQLEANGLTDKEARFKDESLRWIIEGYTREAGVRNLERNIAPSRDRSPRKSSAALSNG